MNKTAVFILGIIVLIMAFLTLQLFDEELSANMLAGGSIGSTMVFCGPNKAVVVTLVFLSIGSIVAFRKRFRFQVVAFTLFFILWFFCGRTIGVHWSGQVFSGWYSIKTGQFHLCNDDPNCPEGIIGKTEVEDAGFGKVRFTNPVLNREILAGPFVARKLEKYFSERRGL